MSTCAVSGFSSIGGSTASRTRGRVAGRRGPTWTRTGRRRPRS
jgi:hypothetical protein